MEEEKKSRQLLKMLHQLSILKEKPECIVQVASNLIFLRDAMDNIEEDWECEFNEQVLNLESLSCATEEQIKNMGSEFGRILIETTDKLYELISKA